MKNRFILITGLILLATTFRLIAHLPNFTPLGAIALFSGAMIANRFMAILVPFLALFISDLYIGLYGYEMIVPYAGFGLTILMGFMLRNKAGIINVLGVSMVSSLVFFLFTNFALFYPVTLYPHTLDGVVSSYLAGIPFLKNALMGDLFYASALFGSYYLITINVPLFKKAA
jgi:hypothetical protein